MEALEQEEGAEEENRTPSFTDLESKFLAVVSERLGAYYYDIGFRSYNAEEFDKAIPALERAYRYNNTNVDALFYLGNSCRQSGDTDRAKEVYAQVIDNSRELTGPAGAKPIWQRSTMRISLRNKRTK